VAHRTVRCNKTTRHSNGQLFQTLMDALTWRAPDSEQCGPGRHRTVWCAHRQQTSPTAMKVVGGYKYSQPPHLKLSKFSEHPIHCKSKKLHSKTHPIDQILSKPPNQLNSIRDLREGVLCSFVALVARIGLFFFPSYFSRDL
jgi:hypothetical protein